MKEKEEIDLSSLRIKRTNDNESGAPRGKWIRAIVIGAVLLIVVLAGYYGFGLLFERTLEVQLTTVVLSSPSQANAVLTASGYVVAERKAAVASKATGRLEFLGVEEGDRVKKGQILARIENADMKAVVDQARANLKLNRAEFHDALQTLERQRALLDKGLTTQAEYDASESRHMRVVASIEVAEATVASAEVALENTLIRAPFDGTVLTKNADVGEMVAPMAASVGSRSAVVTIADMTSLEVEADVSESNIEKIAPDQPCEITLDAYPETRYQAYVSKIVPTADRAKATVMVKVRFRSYDSKVLPEMSAKVLFLRTAGDVAEVSAKPILTVNASAVATRDGRDVAYRVQDNKAVEVPVTVGKKMGGVVEIVTGLKAGEKVISAPDDAVRDGVAVKTK